MSDRPKWFLAGLGTGLIVCGLVLRLAGSPGGGSEDWKEEAKQNGYLFFRQEEVDAMMRKAAERAQATEAAGSPSSSSTPAPISPSPSVSPLPTFSLESGRIMVWIPSGATAEEVVRILAEAGVVRDAKALQAEIAVRGKTRRIVAGVYWLDPDMPVRDVVDRITTP